MGEIAQGEGLYRNQALISFIDPGSFLLLYERRESRDSQRRRGNINILNIGVLASGRGSNFQSIIDAVESGYLKAGIKVLITDNPEAYAIERAKKHSIEHIIMAPRQYESRDNYFHCIGQELIVRNVELVVLAGFMRIVGNPLIERFRNRIMNIHPALLPSFPGLHGQRQAFEYGAKISGCTVHFVDEGMDTGPVIIQAAVPVNEDDTEDSLAERILKFEHKIYPQAIRLFSENRLSVVGRKVHIRDALAEEQGLISPTILQ